MVAYEMSERHACRLTGLATIDAPVSGTGKTERDAALRVRLKELAAQANAVWLSTADGHAGARRDAGEP